MGTFGRPDGQRDAVMRPNRADVPWMFFLSTPSLQCGGAFYGSKFNIALAAHSLREDGFALIQPHEVRAARVDSRNESESRTLQQHEGMIGRTI